MRMSGRGFTHPNLAERLGEEVFNSVCDLQEGTQSQNTVGEVTYAWATKHTANCRFSAESVIQPRAQETTTIFATHRAILVGEFKDVRPDTWRAVIDGVTYNIKSVDWSEGFTQLEMDYQSPEAQNG